MSGWRSTATLRYDARGTGRVHLPGRRDRRRPDARLGQPRGARAHARDAAAPTFWSRSRGELWEKGATAATSSTSWRSRRTATATPLLLSRHPARPGLPHRQRDLLRRAARASPPRSRARSRRGATPTRATPTSPACCTARASTPRARSARRRPRCCSRCPARDEQVGEVADLVFHSLVLLARDGLDPLDVFAELARRHAASS